MKLCECGCGGEAPIAKENDLRFGWTKGQPKRFIHGHHRRNTQEKQIFKFNDRWWIKSRINANIPWSHVVYSNKFLAGEEVREGFEIHHKNRTCNDDRPENLQLLSIVKHRQMHFGKSVALESQDGRVLTFTAAASASRYLNLRDAAVSNAIKSKCRIKGYIPYYLVGGKPDNVVPQLKKAVILEGEDEKTKTFESATEASKWLGLNSYAVGRAIHKGHKVGGFKPYYL